MIEFVVTDPFFWATVSMFGLVASGVVVAGGHLSRRPSFGVLVVVLWTAGRVVLVLPFCAQPRFAWSGWHAPVGALLFAIGLGFCAHGLRIRPFTAPESGETLRTSGAHAVVRHPLYLGGLLWTLGWSIGFRSVVGVALVPVWWLGLLCLISVEEASLERTLGVRYREYKERVRGRIIPGLPV
jgi:protein-S-isoprenylcysteine O-methyltransferase Ste14